MYRSVILWQAKEDIREAANWYNMKQKGLGKRFTFQVQDKVRFIEQFPDAGQNSYDDVSTVILNIFPFIIHYITDEQHKKVIVIAVLHTSRNPEWWMKSKR